jgi:hypothetical protein
VEVLASLSGLVQWAWAALVVPLCGGAAWLWNRWRSKRRVLKARRRFLHGLHPDQKLVLLEFAAARMHTLVLDPLDHRVDQLARMGVLRFGAGVGPYSAISRYVTVVEPFWSMLDDWVVEDEVALQIMQEQLAQQEGAAG